MPKYGNNRLHMTADKISGGSAIVMYGFMIKIKMLVLAKALPTAFLKESTFTKHLLIYLLQQTKVFNSGLNVS